MRPAFLLTLVLLVMAAPASAGALVNQLKNNPSPYLALHGDDPVHWQLWEPSVFERAHREHKLVYVSSGYFACRWCHVMQRESYRNPDIAAFLNAHFIPVKVDRELDPALDASLTEFIQRTRGYSGWPANVFITPEGDPLIGMVYLPPADFKKLLVALDQRWRADRPGLSALARAVAREMQSSPPAAPAPELSPGAGDFYLRDFVRQALKAGDPLEGGFGEPNKFPSAPQLLTLLYAYDRHPEPDLARFLTLTLDNMSRRGLHDQLRGGFFRYVVDPNWQVPHFEKMLYDNALLAMVYRKAAAVLNEPRYLQVADETLDFMLKEMASPKGALVASLSAEDDKGVEGGFYLWTAGALQRLLTRKELHAVQSAWHMQGPPPLPDGYLPVWTGTPVHVAKTMGIGVEDLGQRLSAARKKLLSAQQHRRLPRDTKLLAGWNGLALRALALRASDPDGVRYRGAAHRIRNYLVTELWDGHRLLRARAHDRPLGQASLQDYAFVADGLYAWARVSGKEDDYRLARQVASQGWRRFHSVRGWRLAQRELITFGGSEPALADTPLPSPSAVLVGVSLRLARHFHDAKLRRQALSALNVGQDILTSDPFWYATQIHVLARAQSRSGSAEDRADTSRQ